MHKCLLDCTGGSDAIEANKTGTEHFARRNVLDNIENFVGRKGGYR